MAIRRNISVLNQGISSDIDIVYGTDLVPIEFYITDYSLPDNAIATLYCTTSDNESHKNVGEIANNVITFNPVAGFLGVGKNKLQIRITADEKNLFSFEMCANCKSNMTNDDAVEVESQPTLVTQLLTKVGEVNALFKEIQEENKNAINECKTDIIQLSNPNLFINGNFQIWQRGEEFTVAINEDGTYGGYKVTADKWIVGAWGSNVAHVYKSDKGLAFSREQAEPIYIFQQLEEETLKSILGKPLTMSYGIEDAAGTYQEYRRNIVLDENIEIEPFAIATEYFGIELQMGCTILWAKLEVGELKTPCVPDSKDAIICKLEKQTSPQFAYLYLSSAVTVEGGNTIPFDNQVVKGNTFSISNGIVTVEEELEYVRVNATVGGSSEKNRIWMRILRNNTTVYDALTEGAYTTAGGGVVCVAKKGDTFKVYVNETCTAKGGGVGCYFNIEKIC